MNKSHNFEVGDLVRDEDKYMFRTHGYGVIIKIIEVKGGLSALKIVFMKTKLVKVWSSLYMKKVYF